MEYTKRITTILVVDDEALVRGVLKSMLSTWGFYCITASDGLKAIEVLKTIECDLVLTDIFMPNMDGLELLKYIKDNHYTTDVIVATGYSEEVSYINVIKAGAIDYITKPILRDELEAKISRALRERNLVSELEKMSMYDSLTSLLNRRAFDKKFKYEVERGSRQNYAVFLAAIDVDNFKEYNDTMGHQGGDEVLVALSRILEDCTRNNVDMSFRLGGDEFAIILPQTNKSEALAIVHRVSLHFSEAKFNNLTLSIGIICCNRDLEVDLEQDLASMSERADRALYVAKNGGKNQIICYAND